MSAEDHETEQDAYLRALSKEKEKELLLAVNCLSRRIARQHHMLLIIIGGGVIGLVVSTTIAIMVYGFHI